MTKYVLGFYFNESLTTVALIEKKRPKWQEGRLNGIGGHIENNETPLEAMIREFKEETGESVTDWKKLGVMRGEDWHCVIFTTKGSLEYVETKTDEEVIFGFTEELQKLYTISNLQWLVPAAMNFLDKGDFSIVIDY